MSDREVQGDRVAGGELSYDEARQSRLTFLLYRAVSKMIEVAGPFHREMGISMPASRTLMGLYDRGPQPIGDLARYTTIDLSTISHVLRRLEQQGLATRSRQKADNRIVIAHLTDEGKALARKCRELTIEHEQIMMRGISEAESLKLKSLLARIYTNQIEALQAGEFLPDRK